MREFSNKPIRDEYAKVAGYTLDNVTELAGTIRTFIRECNETFKKNAKYLKSDKSIDKFIEKSIKEMTSRFTWNSKKEGFDGNEEDFKKYTKFTSKVRLYLRFQSGLCSQLMTTSMKLTKMFMFNIANQFLQYGRQTKEYMQEREDKRNRQNEGY
jgi:hypothetical protein